LRVDFCGTVHSVTLPSQSSIQATHGCFIFLLACWLLLHLRRINYLGEEILPDVWANERSFFSRPPYQGTGGKLKRIAEELEWSLPPKSRKPLSGVIELQSLRDKMVHTRPKKESYRRVHKEGEFAPVPATWLYREAPERRVRALIADVNAFAVSLHNAVLQSEFRKVVFGNHPFLGSLGFGTHTVGSAG